MSETEMNEGAAPEGRRLDTTHHWGARPIFERDEPGSNRFRERMIPCCLNCLIDGYEDEPAAFQPCQRRGAHEASNATPPTSAGSEREGAAS